MNANVSVAALAAGNVDYNLILQSVVTANLRGLPLKIAGILIERPNHVVVAHSSVQKFSDLKNKKIAISSFGSLVDILARLTAAHFQLDPRRKFNYVAAGAARRGSRNCKPAWCKRLSSPRRATSEPKRRASRLC